MKKFFIGIGILFVIALGFGLYTHKSASPLGAGGGAENQFYYTSSSMATSSVGIYSWSTILSPASNKGYVSFCNDSVLTNSAIFLGIGATTTVSGLGMAGIRIAPGACYEMTQSKMFYGTIYAIASSATSTLLQVVGSY